MTAQGAFGSKWRIDISSTMTLVPGLDNLEFPKPEKNIVDTTAHDTVGGYQTLKETGYKTQGEIKAVLFWDASDSVHQQIVTYSVTDGEVAMEFETAHGEVIAVNGIIKGVDRKAPKQDVIKAEVMIQPVGAPTITNPS